MIFGVNLSNPTNISTQFWIKQVTLCIFWFGVSTLEVVSLHCFLLSAAMYCNIQPFNWHCTLLYLCYFTLSNARWFYLSMEEFCQSNWLISCFQIMILGSRSMFGTKRQPCSSTKEHTRLLGTTATPTCPLPDPRPPSNHHDRSPGCSAPSWYVFESKAVCLDTGREQCWLVSDVWQYQWRRWQSIFWNVWKEIGGWRNESFVQATEWPR